MSEAAERQYFTVAEAARVLDVSRTTIWRWIAEGRLRAYRAGVRTIRIKREDLRALMQPAHRYPKEPTAGGEAHRYQGKPGQVDIWAGYDPSKVKKALRAAAGALVGVDREALRHDLREARRQASRGRPA